MNGIEVFQILAILFVPWAANVFAEKSGLSAWLSPVVLCFGVGILIGNLQISTLNLSLAEEFTNISVLIAIPLLLMGSAFLSSLKHARKFLFAFALSVLSGLLLSVLIAVLFSNQVENSWQISGMLVGMYTGGTPNMAAIKTALDASEEQYLLLTLSDLLCGAIYLIFLTSVAQQVLGLFLPKFKSLEKTKPDDPNISSKFNPTEKTILDKSFVGKDSTPFSKKLIYIILALLISVSIVGIAIGFVFLVTKEIKNIGLIILLLTSLSILISFIHKVRTIPYSYELGEYFLLMFCVALGMQANFMELINGSPTILYFTMLLLFGTIGLHFLLSAIFKIDRDTTIIASTASIFGPVFIGQVCSVIKNKELLIPGMAAGLIGIAAGNYLGIGMAYLIKNLM